MFNRHTQTGTTGLAPAGHPTGLWVEHAPAVERSAPSPLVPAGPVVFNSIDGDGGDNSLMGTSGADTINGHGGADTLDGGDGFDVVSYTGSPNGVTVDLNAQGAQQQTGVGLQLLSNFEGIYGSGHDDLLKGDAFENRLIGGLGDDTILSGGGDDVLNGGAGVDTISYADVSGGVSVSLARQGAQDTHGAGVQQLSGFENLTGSADLDELTGDSGDNLIRGMGGDDGVHATEGTDTLEGGSGTDTLLLDRATSGVTVDLSITAAQQTGMGLQTILSFEQVVGSGFNDRLTGSSGDDAILGGAGDDTVFATRGQDILVGGKGLDTVSFAAATQGVEVALDYPGFQPTGFGAPFVNGFETLVGSDFADGLIGTHKAERIEGGADDDYLNGFGGADTLDGGAGNDLVDYYRARVSLTVDLNKQGVMQDTGVGMQTLIGIEALYGSHEGDRLTGDGGNNVLKGYSGADTLSGGGGIDRLIGSAGEDTVSFAYATAGVTASLAVPSSLQHTGAGFQQILQVEDLVGSAQADDLSGSRADNRLDGAAGADTLFGGKGADTLVSDGGGDHLQGGQGTDTFAFTSLSIMEAATIKDIASGDQIDLTGAESSLAAGAHFHQVSDFTGEAGEFTLTHEDHASFTLVQVDDDGDGQADASIVLMGGDHTSFTGFVV